MLSAEDHSGLITFLAGIIVLVLAGLGLSLLVDRRFDFSRATAESEKAIRAGGEDIAHLSARRNELHRELELGGSARTLAAGEYSSLKAGADELEKRLADSRRRLEALKPELPALEETFAQYRERYRQSEWAGAVGESLGTLALRGGREYRSARISKVTEVGLEIRHEDGIARVQAPDLPSELRARFQWDDARRTKALREERRSHEEITRTAPQVVEKPRAPEPRARPSRRETPAEDQASRLRADVIHWQTRTRSLRKEHQSALSRASYGAASVPGSLETWQARASRLGKELTKSRTNLAVARNRLAVMSPSDPLLRAEPEIE